MKNLTDQPYLTQRAIAFWHNPHNPQHILQMLLPFMNQTILAPYMIQGPYDGTVKRHNVFRCHGFLDTSFKQTECTTFLHVIPMG